MLARSARSATWVWLAVAACSPGTEYPCDADIVIGDRNVETLQHLSWTRKRLQHLGSWVVLAPQPPWIDEERVLAIYPPPAGVIFDTYPASADHDEHHIAGRDGTADNVDEIVTWLDRVDIPDDILAPEMIS